METTLRKHKLRGRTTNKPTSMGVCRRVKETPGKSKLIMWSKNLTKSSKNVPIYLSILYIILSAIHSSLIHWSMLSLGCSIIQKIISELNFKSNMPKSAFKKSTSTASKPQSILQTFRALPKKAPGENFTSLDFFCGALPMSITFFSISHSFLTVAILKCRKK